MELAKGLTKLPLINTHTHAAMVAFRGIAEDLPLKEWWEENMFPLEKKHLNPDFIYENTCRAIEEMRKNQIAAFCDMYFFPFEMARAAKEMKMPAIIGAALLDFPTADAKSFDKGLEQTEKLIEEYKDDPYVIPSVAPHAIYTVSKENLIRSKELARKYQVLWQIHLAETEQEFKDCQKAHGKTPTAFLDELGLLDENSLLAHAVWLTDEDIEIIVKRKSSVSHCPLSNLKLGSGVAPVAKMIAKGVNVTLGTDGAASSNRLDVWEAAKFAALLQKGVNHDPTLLPGKIVFEMMTLNGVKALGLDKLSERNSDLKKSKIFDLKEVTESLKNLTREEMAQLYEKNFL